MLKCSAYHGSMTSRFMPLGYQSAMKPGSVQLAVPVATGDAFQGFGGRIVTLRNENAYRVIDPPAGTDKYTCDLQFDPGLSVTGKVIGPDGKKSLSWLVPGH